MAASLAKKVHVLFVVSSGFFVFCAIVWLRQRLSFADCCCESCNVPKGRARREGAFLVEHRNFVHS